MHEAPSQNRFERLRQLYRVSSRRAESPERYREFQSFQARLLIGYLERHGVVLRGRTLLDIGSGLGGYSREFAAAGATVIALDLSQAAVRDAGLLYLQGSAMALPLDRSSVDLVFCASVVEHVEKPEAILAEVERVLRPGGTAYISFPPYYSPLGGHEYAPFHYLGERLAMRLRRRRRVPDWIKEAYPVHDDAHSFADLFEGWGLYRLTIRKFRRLLRASGLRCVDMSTRYLSPSFVRWPWIGEVLTWHAQFLLVKPEAGLG